MEVLLLLLVVPFLFGDLFQKDEDEEPAPDINGSTADDTLDGTQDGEEIYAGAGNDVIAAWSGDDLVQGGEGNDFVLGEGGRDLIYGGAGADLVDGGSGNDTIWMGDGDDEIADVGIAPAPEFDTGSAGDDKISGGDGDDLMGDWQGANTLTGELGDDFLVTTDDRDTASADLLFGGWGQDTVFGDDGDTMTGGGFDDFFVVNTDETTDSAVTITDFDGDNEILRLAFDADTFEGSTVADVTAVTDPQTGDVSLFMAGQKLVVLTDPVAFDPSKVEFPSWMFPAA